MATGHSSALGGKIEDKDAIAGDFEGSVEHEDDTIMELHENYVKPGNSAIRQQQEVLYNDYVLT
jgi:hypothetical protein